MDKNLIEKLAKTAKFSYTDEDLANWSVSMDEIFKWIDEIAEIDTTRAQQLKRSEPTPFREEGVIQYDTKELTAAFHEEEENMARVEKVL
ncbi:Asp-tRNAAsn/Glu-tRNAGln amidotransferase C subunit [Parelusimicrobium proximum]|uniref:Asp-tRNA(Asn)/Glu-tRNA(Gln) amidotransferase subunit GatC n=1 Tax=Parelusimicrobium proximum TaxID=3228953 RepID=UPI003D177F3B